MLNCEPMVTNEIKDQDRQSIVAMMPPFNKLRKGNNAY